MPQLSWVLGEPGGLGTGERSGLEPVEKRGQVTLAPSGQLGSRPGAGRFPIIPDGQGDWRSGRTCRGQGLGACPQFEATLFWALPP